MRRARMVPGVGGGGGVAFTASAMAGLGGMAQRGLSDGRAQGGGIVWLMGASTAVGGVDGSWAWQGQCMDLS